MDDEQRLEVTRDAGLEGAFALTEWSDVVPATADPVEIADGWLSSPELAASFEECYAYVGIGLVSLGTGGVLVVVWLARTDASLQ
jgi:hypothetical protein